MASKFFQITDASAVKYPVISSLCVLCLHLLLPGFDIFVNKTDIFSQKDNYKVEEYPYIRHETKSLQANLTITVNIHTNVTSLYLLISCIYLVKNHRAVSVFFQKSAAGFMKTNTDSLSTLTYDCGL